MSSDFSGAFFVAVDSDAVIECDGRFLLLTVRYSADQSRWC